MKNRNFTISQITVAITNIDMMVQFYETVFRCEFSKKEAFGTTLYFGKLGDMDLLLCPNHVAGVEAKQNRQQFDFRVSDLDSIIHNVEISGGRLQGEISVMETLKAATIMDPDGNTIVFIEELK